MTRPTVSVLMCVYNGLPYLPLAIDSIRQQTYTDFEFVIIDDASTDGSAAVLERSAAQDPRIVLARNAENLGLTRSLNKGLALARAPYIARQDDDDVSLPTRLAQQVGLLAANPAVGVVGTLTQVIDAQGRVIDAAGHHGTQTDNAALQEQVLRHAPFCHGSVMLRRQVLDQVGVYDPEVGPVEDFDLWLRMAEVTQLAKVPEVLYLYRFHPESVSRRQLARQNYDAARVLERALARRFGAQPPAERLKPVADLYLASAATAYDRGEVEQAVRAAQAALRLSPNLFGSGTLRERLEKLYVPTRSFEYAQDFTLQVMAGLPASPALARLKGHLLARLHMREVFTGVRTRRAPLVRRHLWQGVCHDPRWLLNRGVWVIAARTLLAARPTR